MLAASTLGSLLERLGMALSCHISRPPSSAREFKLTHYQFAAAAERSSGMRVGHAVPRNRQVTRLRRRVAECRPGVFQSQHAQVAARPHEAAQSEAGGALATGTAATRTAAAGVSRHGPQAADAES